MSPHLLFASIKHIMSRKRAHQGKAKSQRPAQTGAASTIVHGHDSGRAAGRTALLWLRPRGRNWPLLVLAVLGMALAGYLTVSAWLNEQPLFCGPGSACDIVQSSRWATLLGVPVAFWGFLAYAMLVLLAAGGPRWERRWGAAWLLALSALGVSVYLTVISLYVLNAGCKYCLASLGILAAIVALLAWQAPRDKDRVRWLPWLAQSGGVALVLVVLLHLHYSGVFDASAGPEDPYLRDLAVHLTQSGAKFYGASWCPHCQNQKAEFGAAAARLPYVECSPNGPGAPSNPVCVAQGVSTYPTWDIDGQRQTGELRADELARRSHFRSPPAKP